MSKLQDFEFVLVGRSISADVLARFEEEIGGILDNDYKRFLQVKNGGVCKPTLKSSLWDTNIQLFFSLEDEYAGIRQAIDNMNNQVPNWAGRLLPIASDSANRYIAIEIGQPESSMFLVDQSDVRDLELGFSSFVKTLRCDEVEVPMLEAVASQPWAEVEKFILSGGNTRPQDGLSLLCQVVRFDNLDVLPRLAKTADASDMSDAIEVAVLNRRMDALKVLIQQGGDPREALDLSVGPEREEMRKYLTNVIRNE